MINYLLLKINFIVYIEILQHDVMGYINGYYSEAS